MPSKKLQTTFLDFFLLSSQLLTYWWYMKLKEWSSTSNYCTHSCISVWQPFLCFAIFTKQRGSNISHQVLIIINWYIHHYLHHMFTIMFNDVNIIGMYLPPSTMRCFWNIIHREKGWGTLYQHILSFLNGWVDSFSHIFTCSSTGNSAKSYKPDITLSGFTAKSSWRWTNIRLFQLRGRFFRKTRLSSVCLKFW